MVVAGLLGDVLPDLVDGHERVGALVRVDAYGHHGLASLSCNLSGVDRPVGGHAFIEVLTKLLSSHAGRSGPPGERQIEDQPQQALGSEETSQPARGPRSSRRGEPDWWRLHKGEESVARLRISTSSASGRVLAAQPVELLPFRRSQSVRPAPVVDDSLLVALLPAVSVKSKSMATWLIDRSPRRHSFTLSALDPA